MLSKQTRTRHAQKIRLRDRAQRESRRPTRKRGRRKGEKLASGVRLGQQYVIAIPKIFCFLSDPETVLDVLSRAIIHAARLNIHRVVADFTECKEVGLDASTVLYNAMREASRYRVALGKPGFSLELKKSRDALVNSILNAPFSQDDPRPATVVRSPLIRGRSLRNAFTGQRDKAGTEIVDYFARSLASEGMILNREGCKYIGNLITEALGNAEEHGGPWVAQAYYVQQEANQAGECHLVLFNSGSTIYERMNGPDCAPHVRHYAKELAKRHLRRGFFDWRPRPWNEECLFTLYALQEGVSSKLHERRSRGNGTIEVIKAFSELATSEQRMCILSGSAYILFDGTHALSRRKTSENENRQTIAFNSQHDLELPPDGRFVHSIRGKYRGTVVSLRFPFDKAKMARIAERICDEKDV